jgi:hypothetical protein
VESEPEVEVYINILKMHKLLIYTSIPTNATRLKFFPKNDESDTPHDSTTEKSGSLNDSSARSLIIGTQDFDEILEEIAAIIDKTLFIKEFMQDRTLFTVILRPRRFGKSLNLSMLKSFLSLGQESIKFS